MGCGHSKIHIYKKTKSKNASKKSDNNEKTEEEEEETPEIESEANESVQEDCDQKKTTKIKIGGPLVAHLEISSSQQDFFKMLDEKVESGPDYNSESEMERAAETARIRALMKDWETASAGSRSLPPTPKRRPNKPSSAPISGTEKLQMRVDGIRSAEVTAREMSQQQIIRAQQVAERTYISQQLPAGMIHQSYGVPQVQYRPVIPYNSNPYAPVPNMVPTGGGPPPMNMTGHQMPYPPATMQYQAISPMYNTQPNYQPNVPPQAMRHYPSYNQHGSPIKTYVNNSPKHNIPPPSVSPSPYEQTSTYSPGHKLYGPPVPAPKAVYNGELVYSQVMPYPQYKDSVRGDYYKDPVMRDHQPTYSNVHHQMAPNSSVGGSGGSYRTPMRSYQTSISIPIANTNMPNQTNEVNVSSVLHRKQYELT